MNQKVRKLEKKGVTHFRWAEYLGDTKTRIGFGIVVIFVILAIFAPMIAPNDPLYVDVINKLQPPSQQFWFGTDNMGRCLFSRIVWGSRYSLLYSFIIMVITVLIGVPIGLVSGYIGGKVDNFIMRIIDLFMAMPSFVLALAIAGTLGPSGKNLVFAMSCVYWASYARLSRALTIQVKEQSFILALKAGGCSHTRIIFGHILKNIMDSIVALATMEIGGIILSIAGFSFIGLGVQPPTPEWGIMLSDSKNYIQTCPRLMLIPGIVVVIVVMAFNLLGDGLKNGRYER